MKNRTRILLLWLSLCVSVLACNMERVLNPSLPTHTPSPAAQSEGLPPAATPLPTPIATPAPGARIQSGEMALFNGDWDLAISQFRAALENDSAPEIQSAALLGIARAQFAANDSQAALGTLNLFFTQHSQSAERGLAFFLAGQIYTALGQHAEAALAYGEYLAARPGLADTYAHERIGDALVRAGNHQGAIAAYLSALAAPKLGDGLHLNLKIGDAYLALGDRQTALVTYQDILNRTSNDFTKALMLYNIGQIYIAQGNTASGYQAYTQAVDNYPAAYSAYLALVQLVENDQPVNEYQRGLINYFVGQYGLAIAAFDRYIEANPDTHNDASHYFIGRSYLLLGQSAAAIAEWQEQLRDHPGGQYEADAVSEIAAAQIAGQQDFEAAISTYLGFVDQNPEHPRAAEFLFFAGRTAERNNDLRQAAEIWQRLGARYSGTSYGPDGFFQAGLAFLRLGDNPAARNAFQSAVSIAPNGELQARAYFWLGKTEAAAGNRNGAQDMWDQAARLDPTGYYSERARQLLAGETGHFPPPENLNLQPDLAAERAAAESWLVQTFNLPADTELSGPGPLAGDLRFQRGTELWRLGLYNEARFEFENLRTEIAGDPANTYRLANHLIDLGLYRSGIIAARQVLNLVGYDDAGTLAAPVYFNRLRFGLYFEELVFPAAAAYGFEPLFLLSVMRQESLFEGFVTSSAGARGLMQIIPSTGGEIHSRSGWPANYTAEDLYRPLVSVTYGADYLARQRNAFNGDFLAALAAYNGGPGNSAFWLTLANGDPDLFVEVIRFEETRNYLRSIYEQYHIYRLLYENN